MYKLIKRFRSEQDGAISVDWVVLTAAIVGLAVGTIVAIQAAAVSLATDTSDAIAQQSVGTQASGSGG